MPVGLSDGSWHEDYTTMVAMSIPKDLKRVVITKSDPAVVDPSGWTADRNELNPDVMLQNREMDRIEVDPNVGIGVDVSFKRPLGGSTEPAGALFSEGGSQTPGNTGEVENLPEIGSPLIPSGGQFSPGGEGFNRLFGVEGERIQLWPERMVRSALTAAGDVLQGKVPMWAQNPETGEINTSIQAIEKANDLAALAVVGPAPVAAKLADGSLGSFMGVRAKGFNNEKLRQAQRMEQEGVHPDDIWQQTGTFRGADRRWRQEIPDKEATLNPKAFDETIVPGAPGGKGQWEIGGTEDKVLWSPKAKGYLAPPETNNPEELLSYLFRMSSDTPEHISLDKVLNHPKLFEAYPELKKIKIAEYRKTGPEDTTRGMLRSDGTIELAPGDPGFIRSVLLHEVQHAIQRIEGFARGGSPDEFMSPRLKEAKTKFEDVRNKTIEQIKSDYPDIHKNYIEDTIAAVKTSLEFPNDKGLKEVLDILKAEQPEIYPRLRDIAESEHILATEADKQFTQYRRLAGEVESRNTQARMDFGAVQRFLKSPESTEDVPRFLQRRIEQTERIKADQKMEMELPGLKITEPRSPRWPNNDNAKPLNEFQQWIKDYDELAALRESLGTPSKNKFGNVRHWSDLDYAKYSKAGRAFAKKYGQTWEDIKPLDLSK